MRGKDSIARRLALEKLRELRASGLSYREIGLRYRDEDNNRRDHSAFPSWPSGAIRSESPRPGGAADSMQDEFVQALDALREGLAFYDRRGVPVVMNRAFSAAITSEIGADRLAGEVDRFVAQMLDLTANGPPGRHRVEPLDHGDFWTGNGRYYMRGSYIGFDLFGRGSAILVELRHSSPALPAENVLTARLGLTTREARVALLLADGLTNEELSQLLAISPHTARTHTKRVMRKLGLRSRAEVRLRLQEV